MYCTYINKIHLQPLSDRIEFAYFVTDQYIYTCITLCPSTTQTLSEISFSIDIYTTVDIIKWVYRAHTQIPNLMLSQHVQMWLKIKITNDMSY